jgi:hypothetical protein
LLDNSRRDHAWAQVVYLFGLISIIAFALSLQTGNAMQQQDAGERRLKGSGENASLRHHARLPSAKTRCVERRGGEHRGYNGYSRDYKEL